MALTQYMLKRQQMKLKGDITTSEIKPLKAIPKESEKMKDVKYQLKKLYPIYIAKHPCCNIQSPVCTKKATCVNHTKGRGENVLNQDDWEASCTACNGWIEEHHEVAAIADHKKSIHKISDNG